MDKIIIVAIIGSVTALIGVLATTIFGFLTWSRNIKYQILKDERDRLEKKSEYVLERYRDCLKENIVDARLAAVLQHEFPISIAKEFDRAMSEGAFSGENEKVKKEAYFNMAFEISKSINIYNSRIQQTTEIVDKEFAFKLALEIIKSGILKW